MTGLRQRMIASRGAGEIVLHEHVGEALRRHLLDVGAGGEGLLRAGDDDGAHPGRGVRLGQRLAELLEERWLSAFSASGRFSRMVRDMVLDLDDQRLVGHGAPPLCFPRQTYHPASGLASRAPEARPARLHAAHDRRRRSAGRARPRGRRRRRNAGSSRARRRPGGSRARRSRRRRWRRGGRRGPPAASVSASAGVTSRARRRGEIRARQSASAEVDVAEARDDPLVAEHGLDRGPAAGEARRRGRRRRSRCRAAPARGRRGGGAPRARASARGPGRRSGGRR